jgi:pSer/pThr/pTyr-binding forkhead associated (FHA) protein
MTMGVWTLRASDTTQPLTFRLRAGAIKTVGRARRADFVVDAALVSRFHCRLTAAAEHLEVEDLNSTNGTFVNGRRVQRAVLEAGDRLGVGRMELRVERPGRASRRG